MDSKKSGLNCRPHFTRRYNLGINHSVWPVNLGSAEGNGPPVAISISRDELIGVAAAAAQWPTCEKPVRQTIYKYIHRGVGGVRLEAKRVRGRLVTTPDAINRFLEATSDLNL